MPFLTCGGDLGRREPRHRGTSALSGQYVVEDVHLEGGETVRRLVFLANTNVIQSEARLRRGAAAGRGGEEERGGVGALGGGLARCADAGLGYGRVM